MVRKACQVVLAVMVGVLLAFVTFAIVVMPFFGVWEPLVGSAATLAVLGLIWGATK